MISHPAVRLRGPGACRNHHSLRVDAGCVTRNVVRVEARMADRWNPTSRCCSLEQPVGGRRTEVCGPHEDRHQTIANVYKLRVAFNARSFPRFVLRSRSREAELSAPNGRYSPRDEGRPRDTGSISTVLELLTSSCNCQTDQSDDVSHEEVR